MQSIELKSNPQVKRLVLAAFGAYRKHQAFVSSFAPIRLHMEWDGGSKKSYMLVELSTGKARNITLSDLERASWPKWDELPAELTALPPGYALVEGGVFCGKTATAHVYVPEGMVM